MRLMPWYWFPAVCVVALLATLVILTKPDSHDVRDTASRDEADLHLKEAAEVADYYYGDSMSSLKSFKRSADMGDAGAAYNYATGLSNMCNDLAYNAAKKDGHTYTVSEIRVPGPMIVESFIPKAHAIAAMMAELLPAGASYGDATRAASADAMRYFVQAATAGDGRAAYNLGVVFTNGILVPQDLQSARRWYELATQSPHEVVSNAGRRAMSINAPTPSLIDASKDFARTFLHPLPYSDPTISRMS